MSTSSNTAKKIQAATDTIEHVFNAAQPPLAAGLHKRFAVVQRPIDENEDSKTVLPGADSIVELLSVTPENQLLHMRPDSESDTGWRESRIALPSYREDRTTLEGDVVEINAFYQSKNIYALLHYQDPVHKDSHTILPMRFDEKEGWRELSIDGHVANALYLTRQAAIYRTADGRHLIYGVSTAFEHPQLVVVFETREPGVFDAVHERIPNEEATYRLLPGDPEGDQALNACLRIDRAGVHLQAFEFDYDEDEDEYYFEWGEEQAEIDLGYGELTAANVFPFPSLVGTQSLLLLGEDNQLHYVAGYENGDLRTTPLTGIDSAPAQISQIALGRDEHNRAIVFALSANDSRLWVLRQSGVSDAGDLAFATWVCLGNRANVIGAPRAMLDGAELFLVNSENRGLEHMRQDRDTTFWSNSTLLTAQESDQTLQATSTVAHAVELEVLSGEGGPVANSRLEVQTSHSVQLTVWRCVQIRNAGYRLALTMQAE